MFTVRRMTVDDKPAMLEISSRIWEGTDYIPTVFDEWVADREGEFAAVVLGDRLVGCGKLTFLTPADAWLEGLRKDPQVKERGLAEAVAVHFLSLLSRRPGLASLRFSAYIGNRASISANERLGFRLRTALSCKVWEGAPAAIPLPVDEAAARDHVRVVRDERCVREFLDQSGYFTATEGLAAEGWRAYPFSREHLAARYVRTGLCRGIMAGGALAALSLVTTARCPSELLVRLVCLDAVDDALADLMIDDLFLAARAAADREGVENCEIEWIVPRVPRLLRWCAARGLHSWEREDDFLVYELPLDRLEAALPSSDR